MSADIANFESPQVCPPSPEYNAIIDFAAQYTYNPELLGDLRELKNKHNCDITTKESAELLAEKELSKLDPGINSYEIDPESLEDKTGIGVAVLPHDRRILLAPISDDSPAARANVMPGDELLAVDGRSVVGQSVTTAVELLKKNRNVPGSPMEAGLDASLWTDATGRVFVNQVEFDSAPDQAGLQKYDRILSVNGQPVDGISLVDTVQLLHGEAGTQVYLTVERSGARVGLWVDRTVEEYPQSVIDIKRSDQIFQVSVDRDRVVEKSVRTVFGGNQVTMGGWRIPDDAAYVRIRSFQDVNTVDQLWDALSELNNNGSKVGNSNALILDLRNNPGGLLDAVMLSAAAFIEEGRVFSANMRSDSSAAAPKYRDSDFWLNPTSFESRTGDDGHTTYRYKREMNPGQLIVLTNEGTVGTAELLAAALKETAGATIIGTQTAGIGEAKLVMHAPNSQTILQVPVGRLFTPSYHWLGNGRDVRNGVTPNITVENAEGALPGSQDDLQLKEAIDWIEFQRN